MDDSFCHICVSRFSNMVDFWQPIFWLYKCSVLHFFFDNRAYQIIKSIISKGDDRPFSCLHPTLERNNRRNNHERYTSNFEIAIFIP
nr:MAG TPA: hypothetical protein [Caudoviricetes sp.]